jgi:hypothetical protein
MEANALHAITILLMLQMDQLALLQLTVLIKDNFLMDQHVFVKSDFTLMVQRVFHAP